VDWTEPEMPFGVTGDPLTTSAGASAGGASSRRIVVMGLWDRDAIGLVGPTITEIRADCRGSFRLIAMEGRVHSGDDGLSRRRRRPVRIARGETPSARAA
jgi:hypothetical protein